VGNGRAVNVGWGSAIDLFLFVSRYSRCAGHQNNAVPESIRLSFVKSTCFAISTFMPFESAARHSQLLCVSLIAWAAGNFRQIVCGGIDPPHFRIPVIAAAAKNIFFIFFKYTLSRRRCKAQPDGISDSGAAARTRPMLTAASRTSHLIRSPASRTRGGALHAELRQYIGALQAEHRRRAASRTPGIREPQTQKNRKCPKSEIKISAVFFQLFFFIARAQCELAVNPGRCKQNPPTQTFPNSLYILICLPILRGTITRELYTSG
jgi:hypothetical protein